MKIYNFSDIDFDVSSIPTEDSYFIDEKEKIKNKLKSILLDIILKELSHLSQRKQDIIIRYFIFGDSINKIANDLGVSKQYVSKQKIKAISFIKDKIKGNIIAEKYFKKLQQLDLYKYYPPEDIDAD